MAVALAGRLLIRPGRPSEGPETLELGDEPPAVVNLLVNRLHLTGDAATAVLLDLIRRGRYEVVNFGNDREALFVRADKGGTLAPYEGRVDSLVRELPTVREGIPVDAIREAAVGDEQAQTKWWAEFRKGVVADARARGLVASRFPVWLVRGLQLTALLIAAVAVMALGGETKRPTDPAGWAVLLAIAGAVFVFVALRKVNTDELRFTRQGLEVAGRWLGVRSAQEQTGSFTEVGPSAVTVWGEQLCSASALGIARETSRRLPLVSGDRGIVWYPAGDRWNHVQLRKPGRNGWGNSPWTQIKSSIGPLAHTALLLGGITFIVMKIRASGDGGASLVADIRSWIDTNVHVPRRITKNEVGPLVGVLVVSVIAILYVHALVSSVRTMLMAIGDLVLRRRETGVVAYNRGGLVGIHDGQSDRMTAFRIGSNKVPPIGTPATLVATRFFGHVRSITPGR